MADANHQTEILAGLLSVLVGGFLAYVRRLVKALEEMPFVRARVQKVEGELKAHLKEAANWRETYVKDMANMAANQAADEKGQQQIVDSISGLTETVATFHRDLNTRIDKVMEWTQRG